MGYGFGNRIAVGRRPITAVAQAGSSLATPYAWWGADYGVTQSGGYVTEWADKSGNGKTLYPSGDYGPVYYATGLQSKPALFFVYDNKSGIVSSLMQASPDATSIKSVVAVALPVTGLGQYGCIIECSGGGLYSCVSADFKAGILYWGTYFGASNYYSYVYPEEPAIFAYSANATGTLIRQVKVDGIDEEISSSVVGAGNTSRSDMVVGIDSSFGQPSRSYLAELVLFDYELTTGQLDAYISLFRTKYGL
ncbi:MAG: hypothetical protein EBT82_02375 [Micrococcales bacterium]|nr:hypothetical protein [Micrococcales bacterium]NBR54812.1 hypothetical protein [Micrococcales bacterium]